MEDDELNVNVLYLFGFRGAACVVCDAMTHSRVWFICVIRSTCNYIRIWHMLYRATVCVFSANSNTLIKEVWIEWKKIACHPLVTINTILTFVPFHSFIFYSDICFLNIKLWYKTNAYFPCIPSKTFVMCEAIQRACGEYALKKSYWIHSIEKIFFYKVL